MKKHDVRPAEKARYSVYVIKLDAVRLFNAGRCPSPRTKCVYVGQTSKPPKERFRQHKAGIHAARVVRDFGISLRHGLTRDIGLFSTERESLRAERRVGNRLKVREGYKVWGGQGKKFMAGAKSK